MLPFGIHICLMGQFDMLHCGSAGDALKRRSAAVSLLSCYHEHMLYVCMFASACVCVHLFVMCCAPLAASGNGRCRPCLLAVKFYEGFCKCEVAVLAVSSRLL